jgi:predicted dehydrogenase
MPPINRRQFLNRSAGVASAAAGLSAINYSRAAAGPNDRLNVAVMGIRGRGKGLASEFASLKDAHVVAVCDVDDNVIAPVVKIVEEKQGNSPPRVEKDVRKLIDDKSIDALVIAAPNHWHSLATVWACQAGKDVYVEKPVSHNIWEGRKMVEAARKYDRVVQAGPQRRSSPHWAAAHEYVQSGKLGKVSLVRAWVIQKRVNIGKAGGEQPIPDGVDYNLWLGPAPMKPLTRMKLHYDWHWFWDYGGGELANNGIHMLDIARRGVGIDYPLSVASGGGKFYFDDDQETPDTQVVTYEYPNLSLVWEHRTWSNFGFEGRSSGVAYCGDQGTLVVDDKGWQVTVDGKVVETGPGSQMEMPHLQNFIDCVKDRRRPNADIEIAHISTSLCHLGNISQRVGRKLAWDGAKEKFRHDDEANKLLGREYRRPFVVPDQV